jgi:hypothetical protein
MSNDIKTTTAKMFVCCNKCGSEEVTYDQPFFENAHCAKCGDLADFTELFFIELYRITNEQKREMDRAMEAADRLSDVLAKLGFVKEGYGGDSDGRPSRVEFRHAEHTSTGETPSFSIYIGDNDFNNRHVVTVSAYDCDALNLIDTLIKAGFPTRRDDDDLVSFRWSMRIIVPGLDD